MHCVIHGWNCAETVSKAAGPVPVPTGNAVLGQEWPEATPASNGLDRPDGNRGVRQDRHKGPRLLRTGIDKTVFMFDYISTGKTLLDECVNNGRALSFYVHTWSQGCDDHARRQREANGARQGRARAA